MSIKIGGRFFCVVFTTQKNRPPSIIVYLTIMCVIHYNMIRRCLMSDVKKIIDNFIQELKRGTLVLSVLLSVKEPTYGYSLVQMLQEKDIDVDQNTLYPLLRRLEKQELLNSEWDTEGSRPRKYYIISEIGLEVLNQLIHHWRSTYSTINELIESEEEK